MAPAAPARSLPRAPARSRRCPRPRSSASSTGRPHRLRPGGAPAPVPRGGRSARWRGSSRPRSPTGGPTSSSRSWSGCSRRWARRPARFCEAFARAPRPDAFAGFRYRFNQPADVAALSAAAGHVRLLHGSLGDRFAALYREEVRGGEERARARARCGARPLRPRAARGAAGAGAPRPARPARPCAPPARRSARRRVQALEPLPALDGAGTRRRRPRHLAGRAAERAARAARHARGAHREAPRAHPPQRHDLANRGGDHGRTAPPRSRGPGPLRLRPVPPRDERRLSAPERSGAL